AALLANAGLELPFHALGLVEAPVPIWLIRGQQPLLIPSFILETVNRLIIVAFKFVPFQVGVGEAGTAFFTEMLGLGSASGLTLAIVRKARMGVWSLVGTILLVRHGLSARRILTDVELTADRNRSSFPLG